MSRSLRKVIEQSPAGTQFTREGLLAAWDTCDIDAANDALGIRPGTPWRFTVGRKGRNRVTVYERRVDGPINIEWWDAWGRHRQSLANIAGHPVVDRKLARDVARAWADGTIGPNTVATVSAFVYFVEAVDSGRIKIGLTRYPHSRLNTLRTAAAAPLEVLGVVPTSLVTERELHEKFADLRTHGEWFRDHPSLRETIRQLVAGRPLAMQLRAEK